MAYVRPSYRDVTRTHSFSGSSGKQPHYATLTRRQNQNETPLVRRISASDRPSLAGLSHDSQMVLPTQRLIPDPRRTKTCLDIRLPHSSKSEESYSETLSCDDVETDVGRKVLVEDSRVRIGKLVQYLDRDAGQPHRSLQGFDNLLESICSDFGYSEEEYSSLKSSKRSFCSAHLRFLKTIEGREPRASLDHLTYFSDRIARGLAHLTFRTRITAPNLAGLEATPTLMKVGGTAVV